ncbi:MAG: hypothetical protein KF784_02220 [Fimbriimonadaceae bacterium]|nr:hypothetical protein [Fimbriimonadaceae bacterium]
MVTIAAIVCLMSAPQLRLEPSTFSSHYATLKTLAIEEEKLEVGDFRVALKILQELDRSLPERIHLPSRGERTAKSPDDRSVRDLYWTILDSLVFSCTSITALEGRLEQLPEKIGGHLDARSSVQKIVEAMKASAKAYSSGWAVKDGRSIAAATDWWKANGANRTQEIFSWLDSMLGVESAPAEIKVIPVPRYPAQGAITLRTITGPLVLVSCEKFRGADFAEALLHECIHALEAGSKRVELLADLRTQLRAKQVDSFDEEQLPHALFFIIAAEATRRFIDSDHKDVGHKIGTYKRGLEPFRAFGAPILSDLIDGKIDRRQAVAKLSAYR